MRLAAFFASPLVLASALALHAQSGCDAGAAAGDAARVSALRTSLRATPQKDSPDTDVPPGTQALISQLKSALAQAVHDSLACSATSDAPAEIQTKLAALLKANPPQPVGNSVSNGDPRYREFLSFEWSSNLLVHVWAFSPTLLAVQLSFHIPYSQDTMLLVYRRDGDRWREALRWQAQPYRDVGGAFGDGFFTALLTPSPGVWRVVAIHGHAQAASRFSVFSFDILAPTSNPERPRVAWHSERSYSIGDYPQRLKVLRPDIFEFRNHNDEMQFNEDGFERLVVYRYQLSGDKVTRLEPIAGNARGFVEEWLTMPWEEAAAQSSRDGLGPLRAIHQLSEAGQQGNSDRYIEFSAGPVRACTQPGRYLVEFGSMTKSKGDVIRIYATKRDFFSLEQGSNGYRMIGVSEKPDPSCNGLDLMRAK